MVVSVAEFEAWKALERPTLAKRISCLATPKPCLIGRTRTRYLLSASSHRLKHVFVTPAQAGVPNAAAAVGWHTGSREAHYWIPAYAGMTT